MKEKQNTEWKSAWHDDYLKWICGFANAQGGKLVIGKDNEGWTVEKLLKKHKSAPYNPLIAGAFFRTGDIEAWGRGIATIRNACRENGTEFPAFEAEPTGMMVEFEGVSSLIFDCSTK